MDRSTAYLTPWQHISFGALSAPIALASVVVLTFVPTYLAIDLGYGLAAIGAIFAFGRVLDIITDPVVGYLSDRTSGPLGSRLPWMLCGTVLFLICLALLFRITPESGLVWIIITVSAYFLAYTILDLPYSAVGLELSPHRDERTRLASVKAAFQIIGSLAAAILVAAYGSKLGDAFNASFVVIALSTLAGLALFSLSVPRRAHAPPSRQGLFRQVVMLWSQRDYRLLMIAFFLAQAGTALMVGLTALFVLQALGSPGNTGLYIAVVLIASALGLPVWSYLCRSRGKLQAWRIALCLGSLVMMSLPLFAGGEVWAFCLFCALMGLNFGADAIIPTSMLADLSSRQTDNAVSGVMLGYKNALSKMGFVLPMGLAFPVLQQFGFNTEDASADLDLWPIFFFYAYLPAVLRLGALTLMMRADHSVEASVAAVSP